MLIATLLSTILLCTGVLASALPAVDSWTDAQPPRGKTEIILDRRFTFQSHRPAIERVSFRDIDSYTTPASAHDDTLRRDPEFLRDLTDTSGTATHLPRADASADDSLGSQGSPSSVQPSDSPSTSDDSVALSPLLPSPFSSTVTSPGSSGYASYTSYRTQAPKAKTKAKAKAKSKSKSKSKIKANGKKT